MVSVPAGRAGLVEAIGWLRGGQVEQAQHVRDVGEVGEDVLRARCEEHFGCVAAGGDGDAGGVDRLCAEDVVGGIADQEARCDELSFPERSVGAGAGVCSD